MEKWNAAQYLKFERERTQPAIDLADRIRGLSPQFVLDVGCGPGNSTQVLYERFPEAKILGIDYSEAMIEKARENYPHLEFQLCDAGKGFPGIPQHFDLVFSNACIQWIPDHPTLLRNMMGLLKKGGTLAIQVPMNEREPIHQIIGRLTTGEKWKPYFPAPRIFYQLSPEGYFDLLSELSSDFELWNTTYFHRMPSHESIMEWYRGTGLRPYLSALSHDPEKQAEFQKDVLEEVKKAYPQQKNGAILFPFPRFFFTAVK